MKEARSRPEVTKVYYG